MTVAELIERLQGLDGNLSVYAADTEYPPQAIEEIELEDFMGRIRVVLS